LKPKEAGVIYKLVIYSPGGSCSRGQKIVKPRTLAGRLASVLRGLPDDIQSCPVCGRTPVH